MMGGRLILAAAPAGVDAAGRRVAGLVVPWNTPAPVGGIDAPLAFARGSLAVDEGTRLLRNHDLHDVVGAPEWWADSPAAMRAGFRLGRSRSADEALTLAEDDVVTGLSVGAELLDVVEGRGGVLIARAALIREVSLVGIPAYRSARVGG